MDVLILDLSTTTTLLHEAIARCDDEDNINVGVLYFNKRKFNDSNIKFKEYISLTSTNDVEDQAEQLYRLIEKKSDIRLSRALYLDRYVSDKEKLKKYYSNFIVSFYELIKKTPPKLIVGELSLGWELLVYGLCSALNIRYVLPLNVSAFDSPRLAFFNINYDGAIIDSIAARNDTLVSDSEVLERITKRRRVNINKGFGDKLVSTFNLNLFKRFFYNFKFFDKSDYRDSILQKARRRIESMRNKRDNLRFLDRQGVSDLDKNYVLYMLHVQPEVTPDTTATYFSNQYEVIRQIVLRLPYGTWLYVKEHPNGLGARPVQYLKSIAALPNVRFVSNDLSSADAILKAQQVITICGTGSLEAALNGRDAAVFNDVYFSKFPGITVLRSYDSLDSFLVNNKITSSLDEDEDAEASRLDFYKKLLKGTFDCFWHQPYLMDGVLVESNVRGIRRAITRVVELN